MTGIKSGVATDFFQVFAKYFALALVLIEQPPGKPAKSD
jgi:hypothetical protein